MELLKEIIFAFFIVGVLGVMFYTPSQMYKGVYTLEYGSLTSADRLKKWIPIYNVIKAERTYLGKMGFVGLAYLILFLFLLVRIVVIFVATGNLSANHISTIALQVSGGLWLISQMVCVGRILKDADVGVGKMIFYSLLFPLGQDYIGKYLPAFVEAAIKEDKTF